jgi:hypothetical protein
MKLLKLVTFYGIGVLSSNLLASAEDESIKDEDSLQKKLKRGKKLLQKAANENPQIGDEMAQIVVDTLRRNGKNVDENAVEAYRLLIQRRIEGMKAKKKIKAALGWTAEHKALTQEVDVSLIEIYSVNPENVDKMDQNLLGTIFEVIPVSDEEKDVLERAMCEVWRQRYPSSPKKVAPANDPEND